MDIEAAAVELALHWNEGLDKISYGEVIRRLKKYSLNFEQAGELWVFFLEHYEKWGPKAREESYWFIRANWSPPLVVLKDGV